VGPRAGLDDVEKRKFLTPPGLELRLLCRPVAIPTASTKGEYINKSVDADSRSINQSVIHHKSTGKTAKTPTNMQPTTAAICNEPVRCARWYGQSTTVSP
jgi:hypothetical protein